MTLSQIIYLPVFPFLLPSKATSTDLSSFPDSLIAMKMPAGLKTEKTTSTYTHQPPPFPNCQTVLEESSESSSSSNCNLEFGLCRYTLIARGTVLMPTEQSGATYFEESEAQDD